MVKAVGSLSMILANIEANGEESIGDAHSLPATLVGQKIADVIRDYAISNSKPTATILFEGTKVGVQPSLVVATFSSRGPNGITPEILKLDMIAQGVNVLVGWSGAMGPTGVASDSRWVQVNLITVTLMSCTHVSGLVGFLKGAHPDWRAFKSALMTTT